MTTTEPVTVDPPLAAGSVRRAPAPVAVAGASKVGAVLAVGVVALGALGVRDAATAAGWLTGRPWIPVAADAVDGLRPASWTVPAGIAVAVFGFVLVLVALLPRRRTAAALKADTAVYVRRRDVAAIAAAAAREVPGVLSAKAKASPRRVRVRCAVTTADVRPTITKAVETELVVLERIPRTIVRTRMEARP